MGILADELKKGMTMLVEILGYLYMAVMALFMLLAILTLLMIPIIAVISFVDALRGKKQGALSDSFLLFWSAHSED